MLAREIPMFCIAENTRQPTVSAVLIPLQPYIFPRYTGNNQYDEKCDRRRLLIRLAAIVGIKLPTFAGRGMKWDVEREKMCRIVYPAHNSAD